jgi:hypothetical protein
MQKVIRIGTALAAIILLVLTLACGTGALAVHQRAIPPPRLNLQLAGYRITGSPLTIRGKPPKYYYSIWLFVTSYRPGSNIGTETGEQILLVQLRSN